jgi:hypothetical protein
MRRIAIFCAAGLGTILPACGSLDSNTGSAPALATLQGRLNLTGTGPAGVSSSNLIRVAVVWRGDGDEQFNVAEDLPVQPVFPASFTIALDGPPPAAAMRSALSQSEPPPPSSGPSTGGPPPDAAVAPSSGPSAGGPPPDAAADDGDASSSAPVTLLDTPVSTTAPSLFAIGTVVAYLDENHNGKLDLVPDNATAYVDQIVAASPEMSLVYFQGPIPDDLGFDAPRVDSAGHRPKDGYNLLDVPVCNVGPLLETSLACPFPAPAVDAGPCEPIAWLGMDATYPLTIDSSPAVASLMCLTQGGPQAPGSASGPAGPFDPAVQPAQYPTPGDPNLCCDPDGSQYFYLTCMEVSQGLCKGTVESCTAAGYARPTPAPAAWPCAE